MSFSLFSKSRVISVTMRMGLGPLYLDYAASAIRCAREARGYGHDNQKITDCEFGIGDRRDDAGIGTSGDVRDLASSDRKPDAGGKDALPDSITGTMCAAITT
jgi:hypothetical protein